VVVVHPSLALGRPETDGLHPRLSLSAMEYGQKRSRDDYAPEDATYGQGGGRGPPYYGHQQQGGPPPPHQQGRYDPPPGQSSRWSGPEPAYVKQEPNRYEPPPQAAQYEPSPKSYQSPSSGYSFSPARPSRSPPVSPSVRAFFHTTHT
jgi:hypothetical protein